MNILRAAYPHQLEALERHDLSVPSELLRQFDFIRSDSLPGTDSKDRSFFYLGAEPNWSDIKNRVDAERASTCCFIDDLLASRKGSVVQVLSGYAGSGKSTAIKRAATEIARHGKTVFFFKGEDLLDVEPILSLIHRMEKREAFFFVDPGAAHMSAIVELTTRMPTDANVVIVLADQSHLVHPRTDEIRRVPVVVHEMPELDRTDTERILTKLSDAGFLGDLQGKSRTEQVHAFLVRARKQLLVALREATAGKGFDAILAGEFGGLADDQVRLAYTIVCLASLHGALGVRRRHLLACLDGSDTQKARILRDYLRDVVLPVGGSGDLLAPRHRLIGRFVAIETAPLHLKLEATKRLLVQVASEITPESIRRRVPEYVTYRGLINYDGMVELFGEDYDVVTGVYEEVKQYYGHRKLPLLIDISEVERSGRIVGLGGSHEAVTIHRAADCLDSEGG